jgi:hypothetical protein
MSCERKTAPRRETDGFRGRKPGQHVFAVLCAASHAAQPAQNRIGPLCRTSSEARAGAASTSIFIEEGNFEDYGRPAIAPDTRAYLVDSDAPPAASPGRRRPDRRCPT